MKKYLAVIISVFVVLSLAACGLSTNTNQTPPTTEARGKNYEAQVFTAFWESACGSFGVNYSDYKWTHTATSYISDSTTSDGYTAHYYLIKTAFDTENAFGQKINHEVTARCYYVPDYSNVVYTTYLTLDGEKVLFDEETEDWLLGIGGSSTNGNNTNITTPQNEQQPTTTPETEKTKAPSTETESKNKNEQQPTTSSNGAEAQTPPSESVDNNQSDEMDEVSKDLAYQDWLSKLPTLGDIEIETEEEGQEEEDSGDLDGICTSLTPEEKEALEQAANNFCN